MEQIADYLQTMKDVSAATSQLPRERKPLIEKAVEKFVDKVQADAVQNLFKIVSTSEPPEIMGNTTKAA